MAAEFEKRRGQRVLIEEDTVGRLCNDQPGGAIRCRFTDAGRNRKDLRSLRGGSRVELARVGLGLRCARMRRGPTSGSVEAFKRTLRQARSIAYVDPAAGGTSGIYSRACWIASASPIR